LIVGPEETHPVSWQEKERKWANFLSRARGPGVLLGKERGKVQVEKKDQPERDKRERVGWRSLLKERKRERGREYGRAKLRPGGQSREQGRAAKGGEKKDKESLCTKRPKISVKR